VVPTGALGLGSYQLSAGQHTLRAQIVGANTNAVLAYMFGLDYVLLTNATPPAARLAIADNAIGTGPATLDVWFAAPVTLPTAATVSNYSLNLPGLSITNAALRTNLPMGVVLGVSGPVTGDARLSVSGVQGPGGISVSNQIPVLARLGPALNVVANQYQQGRAAALSRSTDGIVQHDANVTTWTTFSGAIGLSDFVGLTYAEPQVFSALKVDLGYQFVDGGDWGSLPRVYVLTHPLDTNQRAPENDPANWTAVTPSLISGNTFGSSPDAPTGTPPPNSPLVFDLSALPYSQRTGYGWAVGGVPGNGPTAQFVSIAELRAYGVSAAALTNLAAAPQILLDLAPPSLTLPVGLPLTWTVIAAGTQPIYYQWQFNGTNIADDSRVSGSHSNVLSVARVLASDSGSFQLIMTNAVGSNASASASLRVTRVALNDGGGWTPNGGATIASNVLTLTDGVGSEARSSFLNLPQYVGAFTASFTYQDVGGGGADGAAFVLQQDSRRASALGGAGGGLGHSGISPSVAIQFNIYANNGVGIQLRTNGLTGAPYVTTAPVNLASGDPIGVTLRYDGAILALVLTDAVAAVSFSTNWSVALPAILGSDSAYVGFTGADGGVASTESISNFSFISLPKLSSQLASTGTILFSWPASAGGFGLQQNSSLNPTTWVKSPGPPELVSSQNQVLVTPAIGSKYYRLMLP
jgi:hypothetical protein